VKSPIHPEHRLALELWLQARQEELDPQARQRLEALLAEDSPLAEEAARLSAFLDHLAAARLDLSRPFKGRLKSCLEGLVRDDVLAREEGAPALKTSAQSRSPSRHVTRRLLLQRSLAVAAGVLLGFLLFMGLAGHGAPRKMLLTPQQADLLPTPHPHQTRPR